MPLNAFVVRPFATKELLIGNAEIAEKLRRIAAAPGRSPKLIESVDAVGKDPAADTGHWRVRINFEAVDQLLLQPVFERLRIKGEAASAVVVAGNIREDMFNRLVTADLVIAELSMHNPNVFYELGVRQAFRDRYTFLIRADLSDYPFDLKTDRYFEYSLIELAESPGRVVDRLARALRETLNSNDADSPIFKLLPQLEAEDRARFIAVPNDFSEEVEWARHQRREEHLSLMAVECDGYLWEIEGLRAIGRAQFECNFIEGAKSTWEQIIGRYPDDIEANSCLSTIYQRLSDMKKSEQALSRVARARSLSNERLSQLRSLSGRNLKAAWCVHWRRSGPEAAELQRAALVSPLLQRAIDAFQESFKLDLNNSYAGLNALTMLVIQTELAQRFPADWKAIQRMPSEAERHLAERRARITQLIAALDLAVEADRDRLQMQGRIDPWFNLLEAAVACVVSHQPEYVAQLFEQARHFAPESAEESIRASLEIYQTLEIGAGEHTIASDVGSIGPNVRRAIKVLSGATPRPAAPRGPQRVLMFVGLRLDAEGGAGAFPSHCVEAARRAIEQAVNAELQHGGHIVMGIAAGANGGDLLFHEVCASRGIATRMCLALRKPQYVGQYVAPAGKEWVERFAAVYRRLRSPGDGAAAARHASPHIREFTDSSDLPRWLQSKPSYNVGRRNNQWMLQHTIKTAREQDDNADITLLALWNQDFGRGGVGGIGDIVRSAALQGIKVNIIPVPENGDAPMPVAAAPQQATPGASAADPAEPMPGPALRAA